MALKELFTPAAQTQTDTTTNPGTDRSTGDQQPSGQAAYDRILGDDGPDPKTVYAFDALVVDLLGAPGLVFGTLETFEALRGPAVDIALALQGDPATTTPMSEQTAVGVLLSKLTKLVSERANHLLDASKLMKPLQSKLQKFEHNHPEAVLEALLIAAIAAYLSDTKAAFNTSFKLGKTLTLKGGGNFGNVRKLAFEAVNASIEFHKGKIGASLGFAEDHAKGTMTFDTQVSAKDFRFLGVQIEEAIASYKHIDNPNGKLPTDQIMEDVKTKLGDYGIKIEETNTLAQPKKEKGVTEAPPRVLDEKVGETVTLPSFHAFGLDKMNASVSATQSFGPNHPQSTFGAKISSPQFHVLGENMDVALGATEPFGGGTKTTPTYDVAFTLNEMVTVSLKYGGGPATPGATQTPAWKIGVSFNLGKKKKKDD